MEDFQQRVVDEKAELDAKIEKLGAFINGGVAVTPEERSRLCDQLTVMRRYSAILGERLGAIIKVGPTAEPVPEPAEPQP